MSHLKTLSSLTAGILFLLFAAPFAFAQTAVDVMVAAEVDATVDPKPMLRPLDVIKARAQQAKENLVPRGVEAQMKMDAKAGARASSTPQGGGIRALIAMHTGVIKNRFRLAINHMNNLLERVGTRLEKMAADGINTATAVQLKADAEVAVDKAEVDAKAVADFAATASDSTDRAAFKAELQAKIKTASDSMKAAQDAIKKLVRSLVDLAKANKPQTNTTTTVETTVE
jgi:hypothetical protein